MKKDDLIIFLIALLLLAGMFITIFFGGEKSRHGVGEIFDENQRCRISLTKNAGLDLGQRQGLAGKV
jgi:hypothetical protein